MANGNAIPLDDDDAPFTRAEICQMMQEQVDNIQDVMDVVNILKRKLNTQAEVLGCHRYILARFVPMPMLEQAVKDFVKERGPALDAEIRHNLSQITTDVHGDGKVH